VLPLGLQGARMSADYDIPASDLELLLSVLTQALERAGALVDREPTDLAGRLGGIIMEMYVRGERDPEKLKKAALNSL
jgi:hypothetical protein